jgi:hypothetical protein
VRIKRALDAFAHWGRLLTGQEPAGCGVTVFPDDVFVVSYPSSGNTWTRFLISNLMLPSAPTTFAALSPASPYSETDCGWMRC